MTIERRNEWVRGKGRKRDTYPTADKDIGEPILVSSLSKWLLDKSNRDRIEDHLDWYLTRYAGRQFEWFSSQDDGHQFTSFHVLAAESLSVKAPPTATRRLLEPDNQRDELLDAIHQSLVPGAEMLWTCDITMLSGDKKKLESSGDMFRLYFMLRHYGFGPVTTSKLLASMFPSVIPIQDSLVTSLLLPRVEENWWLAIRSLFTEAGSELNEYLDGLKVPIGIEALTTLRRLDIILWMEANARRITSKKRTLIS